MSKTIVVAVLSLALAMTGAALHAEEAATPAAPSATAPPATPPGGSPDVSQLVAGPRPCILLALRVLQPQAASTLSKRLSLTEDQSAKLADVLKNAQKGAEPLVEAQRVVSAKFAEALVSDASTDEQLSALADDAMKAEAALAKQRLESLSAVKALLTAEQKAEFAKIMVMFTSPWRAKPPVEGPKPPEAQAPK